MTQVTVITATTGRDSLARCIESVANQTHKQIQHLVFVDGKVNYGKSLMITDELKRAKGIDLDDNIIYLPSPTGNNRWNGHRMYGAGTYLASDQSQFLMFLDDDNTIDPDHIESLLALFSTRFPPAFAFSLRKIVDDAGKFICNDECESLGFYPSILGPNDYFIDVNCWFLPRQIAVMISPLWYRKFREPGQPEIDRIITQNLIRISNGNYKGTWKPTVNYTVGSSNLSVTADFFKHGNAAMLQRYNGSLPWQSTLAS